MVQQDSRDDEEDSDGRAAVDTEQLASHSDATNWPYATSSSMPTDMMFIRCWRNVASSSIHICGETLINIMRGKLQSDGDEISMMGQRDRNEISKRGLRHNYKEDAE